MVRVFVALEISKEIIANLTEIQLELKRLHEADLKFVDPESFHITVKFIGEVEKQKIQAIIKTLQRIQFFSFPIIAQEISVNNFDDPHWVWCTIEDYGKGRALKNKIDEKLLAFGISVEERLFTPHISLARVISSDPTLFMTLKEIQNKSYGSCLINGLKLKESTLNYDSPEYKDLAEVEW